MWWIKHTWPTPMMWHKTVTLPSMKVKEITWPILYKTWHFWLHNPTQSHFVYYLVAKFTLQIYFFTIIQRHVKSYCFPLLLQLSSRVYSVQKTDHKPCTLGLWPRFPWNSNPSRKRFVVSPGTHTASKVWDPGPRVWLRYKRELRSVFQ